MEKKYNKIVMIGNPDSTLFVDLAKEYQFCCDQMILVSRYRGSQTDYVDEKTKFVSTYEHESRLFKISLSIFARFLNVLYAFLTFFSGKKGSISVVEPIIQAMSISSYVNRLKGVDFVVAHNVFTYGLACLLCNKTIRVMRPWGGDVYQYAFNSKWHYLLTKYVLQKADAIDAISPAVFNYLKSKYEVSENLILNASSSYVGAAEVIELHKFSNKKKVREELGLPTDKKIIVNSRRFKHKWGSEEVFNCFKLLAKKYDNLHFVLLSGDGAEKEISDKKIELSESGLINKFTLYETAVDLNTYLKIIFSSDIFYSLMHEADLRSASIMTGLHCDSLPVISDQPEYHEMVNEGAMMQIVDYKNIEEVVKATENYLFDNDFAHQTIQLNKKFIESNINNNNQFAPLLDKIDELKGL